MTTLQPSGDRCLACGAATMLRGTAQFCPACALDAVFSPDDTESPRAFGDYELLAELGRGGQGVVYRAYQKSLHRTVALKVVALGTWATAEHLKRFRLEAEAAARLEHPGIVPIYEIGEREGCCFFSMQLMERGRLDELWRTEPMAESDAARILLAVAQTVQFAHERGVLHRDIKPANILLDAEGRPHLTDFGLAKLLEQDAGMTRSVDVMGTPAYMAPEQAAGRMRETTTAVDVYALGAVFFEMLTGRPPFVGDSFGVVVSQVLEREPERLSTLRPGITRDAQTICLKCLEKDPARRYPSARALAEDVARLLQGEPIQAREISALERATRWCQRNRALALSIAGSLVLLLTLAIGSSVAALRIQRESVRRAHAELDAKDRLWAAQLAQARAVRLSGVVGRRREALAAIREAARMRPSRELRDEAIAALALLDLETPRTWDVSEPEARFDRLFFSPDFSQHLNLRARGGAQVWRTEPRGLLAEFASPRHGGAAVRLSRSGRYLAGTFPGGRLLLWDRQSPGVVHTNFPAVAEGHQPVEFSRDETALFLSTVDRRLHLLRWETGEEIAAMEPGVTAFRMELSVDGEFLALVGGADTQVWNVKRRERIHVAQHRANGTALAWHPDGRHVVFGFDTGAMLWLDTRTGEMASLIGHRQYVDRLMFDPRGEFFASSSWDGAGFWHGITGSPLFASLHVAPIQFERSGRALGTLREPGGLGICEIVRSRSFRVLTSPELRGGNFGGLSFSPDERWLAAGDLQGWHLFATADGAAAAYTPAPHRVFPIFTPDQRSVIGVGTEAVSRWPIQGALPEVDGRARETLVASAGSDFQHAGLSADGRFLAVAGHNRSVKVDLQAPSNVVRFSRGARQSYAAVSPDGRTVAAAAFHGSGVTLWDGISGRPLRQLVTNQNAQVVFGVDGRTLLTAGARDYAVWDTASWTTRWRRRMEISDDVAVPVAVSADGRLWAVATGLQEVTLLETKNGRELARLTPPTPQNLHWLALSSAGRYVAATTSSGSIFLWNLGELRRELAAMNLDW